MDAMVRRYNAEDEFFQRTRLCSRAEIVADPCPVPGSPGVYAWFFREIPPQVPTAGCGRTNAEGSTVRMTLGCLLSDTLGIRLQRLGNRFTFGAGEAVLSEWIGRNAFVSWTLDPEPWLLEDRLIASLDLPLNLQGNGRHPFYPILKKIRPRAKAAARANVTV
jgi:hypothetical protein